MDKQIKARLEYLRKEIKAERISYGEIAELQSLAEHIDENDVLLLEWAGVEEFKKLCNCGKNAGFHEKQANCNNKLN